MLMTLGLFVFALDTIPYQELQRKTSWRLPDQARVGGRPARQFLGPGEDSITLRAKLAPAFTGGQTTLDLLRTQAGLGIAWPLLEGTGRLYGRFAIESIDEGGGYYFADGAAQQIDFRMTLQRVDNISDLVPAVAGALTSLLL